jgi:uncharacterized protein YqgV (UPF0045/DUF77 family)
MSNSTRQINAAIQLLPLCEKSKAMSLIDEAIAVIRNSGLTYQVCPFETVVEGTYEQVMVLVQNIRDSTFIHGGDELVINLKLQFHRDEDLYFTDKTRKHEQ